MKMGDVMKEAEVCVCVCQRERERFEDTMLLDLNTQKEGTMSQGM